eukprot:599427_1
MTLSEQKKPLSKTQARLQSKLKEREAESEAQRIQSMSVEEREAHEAEQRTESVARQTEVAEQIDAIQTEDARVKSKVAKSDKKDEKMRLQKALENMADGKEPSQIDVTSMKEVQQRLKQLEVDQQEAAAKVEKTTPKLMAKGSIAGSSKAKVVSEGDMTPHEQAKMQALLGNAKAANTKSYNGQTGVTATLSQSDVDSKATLVFQQCSDCTYTLTTLCTKVFVLCCRNFELVVDAKIVTQTLEIFKCDDVRVKTSQNIHTVQVDMSDKVAMRFDSRPNFRSVIWAGCEDISVEVAGDRLASGFTECQVDFADLHIERSQFKMHYVQDKLYNDKLIRLDNGFPTTKRELDEFERKQEAQLQEMAAKMGVTIGKKKKAEQKVGRNDKCPCGTGKKYKKWPQKWASRSA